MLSMSSKPNTLNTLNAEPVSGTLTSHAPIPTKNNSNSAYMRNLAASERIYERNIPSSVLQPYFSPRALNSKYAMLPIVEPHKQNHVPVLIQPVYAPCDTFNPGTATAPWSGYASQVNTESDLRGQIYALQKCDQAAYIPSSQSSLYRNNVLAFPIVPSGVLHANHPYLEPAPVGGESSRAPNARADDKVFANNTRLVTGGRKPIAGQQNQTVGMGGTGGVVKEAERRQASFAASVAKAGGRAQPEARQAAIRV